MGRYKRLLSNTAILGAGTFASKVLVFLLMPFYTAILSTSEFGTADIISQTANLLIPLASVGICDGLFRFTLDAQKEDKKRVFSSAVAVLAICEDIRYTSQKLCRKGFCNLEQLFWISLLGRLFRRNHGIYSHI